MSFYICKYEGQSCDDCHLYNEDVHCKNLIEVAPVKHGHWKDKPHGTCSICGKSVYDIDADFWVSYTPPYCPNCGAKMDMKEN